MAERARRMSGRLMTRSVALLPVALVKEGPSATEKEGPLVGAVPGPAQVRGVLRVSGAFQVAELPALDKPVWGVVPFLQGEGVLRVRFQRFLI